MARRWPMRRGNKYHARAREICGVKVGSGKEARRVVELLALESLGAISGLEFHPKFPLVVNGVTVGRITPDATYVTRDGEVVIEDTKSPATARAEAYRLRRKVFEALYPFRISEV